MNQPNTLKSTKTTTTVQLLENVVKVKKTRYSAYLKSGGYLKGGAGKTVKSWKWHCEDLGLTNLTRLEMERALWNECGAGLEYLTCSREEWKL